MPALIRLCWTLTALGMLLPLAGCNRGGPQTPYEEAIEAQEQLEEARDEAAEMISEAEQEGIETLAEARREAEQAIESAKQEAADRVRRAEQELQEKMEQMQDQPLNRSTETPGDGVPRTPTAPEAVAPEPTGEQPPVVDIDVDTEP